MAACACKRGFLVLRSCGQPAVRACEFCSRPICQEHLSTRTGGRFCVECAARQQEQQSLQQRGAPGDTIYDDDWAYSYRHQYYTRYGYRPVLWEGAHDSYYDDYDVRSFDNTLVQSDTGDDNSPDFGDDGDGPDFGDS